MFLERGKCMLYFLCFVIGVFVGVLILSLLVAARENH